MKITREEVVAALRKLVTARPLLCSNPQCYPCVALRDTVELLKRIDAEK